MGRCAEDALQDDGVHSRFIGPDFRSEASSHATAPVVFGSRSDNLLNGTDIKDMPTYEYLCRRCGKTFDLFQSISEEQASACPACGGEVRRLISGGAGFIIKGGSSPEGLGGRRWSEGGTCERETPCCGRETRCAAPPCGG